jgi:hypothetical protein
MVAESRCGLACGECGYGKRRAALDALIWRRRHGVRRAL